MRRLTKRITSIVLLASFTASLSSMALAADTGTVNTDCVRLRREASTSSDSLGMLVEGEKVSILEQEENGWLKITYTDEEGAHTGYISSEFVTTAGDAQAEAKPEASQTPVKEESTPAKEIPVSPAKEEKEEPVRTQQAPADTSAVSLGTGTITAAGKKYKTINLRASATTDADVVCKVPVDASVEILADLDVAGWYQIRYTDGKTVYSGYMLGAYVSTAVSSQPATAATVISTKKAHKAINIRAKKSMDAAVVFQVPVGGTLNVIADADPEGWYQVSYSDASGTYNGYMREEYVDTDNTTAFDLTGIIKTKKKYINIRAEKSTNAKVVYNVPAGKTISLAGSDGSDGWYQVSYRDDTGTYEGYMVSKYVAVTNVSTGTIGTSSAVLRASADSNSKMLCVIPEGDTISILFALGDWYQVEYNQKIGYVDAACISSEVLNKSNGYATVMVDSLRVRAKPSTDSAILTSMSNGDTFRITSFKNGWYRLSFNGKEGYAKAEFVSVADTVSSGYIQVTSQNLKLRSGAGVDFEQLAVIPYGTLLKVTGSLGSWYQVTYKDQSGYVCGDYVSSTTSGGFKAYPDFAKVTASSLMLRSAPSTDSDKCCAIPKDTVVSVTGLKDGWYSVVLYGSQKGYVDATYTAESTGPATIPQVVSADTGVSGTAGASASGTAGTSASGYTASSSGSGSGASVLAYAQQFVGNPYVWGGTSLTNGCDCSGFVKSVYAHFGKSLPHSSYADAGVGRAVSKSDMQPGDIVVYGGHVGIYAGGGKLLSALGKKYGITYCSVNYKPIQAVRRLF